LIATPLSAEPGEEPVSFVSRQDLGRKGIETRRRLMNAARGLLDVTSPIAVTVAAIARAAGTSTGTFYVYFDDVNDIVLALAQEASADLGAVHEALEAWHGGLSADAGAERFVRSFRAYYDAHRAILSIRNMEGDRGDERFARMLHGRS
jgi:AcrR family transcriptional regulator